jgi:hypothetical protein
MKTGWMGWVGWKAGREQRELGDRERIKSISLVQDPVLSPYPSYPLFVK